MPAPSPSLLVLGSAAAEGVPAFFCDCRVCREAAKRGGKDVRGRTAYNFGGTVQIDFGPDMLQAVWKYRDRLSAIRHVLITHAHEDHLTPESFLYHGGGFCGTPTETLTIHGTAPTWARLRGGLAPTDPGSFDWRWKASNLAFHEIKTVDAFELPDVGARVWSVPADHAENLDCVLYVVSMGGRTVLIGHDTGYPREEAWAALEKLRGRIAIDIAVLDDTGMLAGAPGAPSPDVWDRGHMSAPTILKVFDRLDSLGLLAPGCIRAVNHFSHNGGSTHEELEAFYAPRGIVVGYDGLEL